LWIIPQDIWHGGGDRVEGLVSRLCELDPDVLVLEEFRGTAPSREMAATLRERGFAHQVSTALEGSPRQNAMLVASRHPMVRIESTAIVEEHKRIFVRVESPLPVMLLALHVPNREAGTKWQFFDDVLLMLRAHSGERALLIGDLNSGRPGIDGEGRFFNEEEGRWVCASEETGWKGV